MPAPARRGKDKMEVDCIRNLLYKSNQDWLLVSSAPGGKDSLLLTKLKL